MIAALPFQKLNLAFLFARRLFATALLASTAFLPAHIAFAQTLPAPSSAASNAANPALAPNSAAISNPSSGNAPVATSSGANTAGAATETKTLEVNTAAKVVLVEGNVVVIAPSAANVTALRRKVKVGDMLIEGESIVTGRDGELHLDMEDGGYMAIRPNTRMRIVKYQAKGNDFDTGVFSLLQGSFRSVTGWIGKFNQSKYIVRTPNATIGIRGTDHEPLVIPPGATEGEPGTYDKVNAGGSVMTTAQGRAEVAPNQAGFVAQAGKAAPRTLSAVPVFFRATRNERLLEGKHDIVQQRIAERRETRRTEIKKIIDTKKAAFENRAANKAANKAAKKEERTQARAQAKAEALAAKQKAKQDAAAKKSGNASNGEKTHIGPRGR